MQEGNVGWHNKLTKVPLLHLGYPCLTEYLLKKDVYPDVLDDEGNTPLDLLVLRILQGYYTTNFSAAYASVCLLARHGAKLRTASRGEWNEFLSHCAARGVDRGVLKACGQPLWVSGSPSKEEEGEEEY